MDTGHRRRPQKAFATGPPLGRWHPALLLALRFGSAFHDFWLQVLCIATEKASHASEIRLYLKLEVSSFDYTQTRHQALLQSPQEMQTSSSAIHPGFPQG